MRELDYCRPRTLEEALARLADGGWTCLAGGTDLLPGLRVVPIGDSQVATPIALLDIRALSDLGRLDRCSDGTIRIGAAVKLSQAERSPLLLELLPAIAEAAGQIGSVQIRNLGTVGGNLANASPAADLPPTLIALGAVARLVSQRGERLLPVESLFLGPGRTTIAADELLVELLVPPQPAQSGCAYLKLAGRPAMDLAIVGVAASAVLAERSRTSTVGSELFVESARVALASVGPVPLRAESAERAIVGAVVEPRMLEANTEPPTAYRLAGEAARDDCRPIDDHRASANYRYDMIGVFAARALAEAARRAALAPVRLRGAK